jgi:uncharacterized membrane protein
MVLGCTTVVSGALVLVTLFNSGKKKSLDPKEVLAKRFAAGEIDQVEYLTRLSILEEARELNK